MKESWGNSAFADKESLNETTEPAEWYETLKNRHEPDGQLYDIAILIYGSLLHPEELERLLVNSEKELFRVQVNGYERRFSMPITDYHDNEDYSGRGALNLHSNPERWMNGILVGPLKLEGLRRYATRERCYSLAEIAPSNLNFYSTERSARLTYEKYYTPVLREGHDKSLRPHPEYLDLCLEGARNWSDDFYGDFLKSTYVEKQTLKDYLNCRDAELTD
jgi:hypothetical protein